MWATGVMDPDWWKPEALNHRWYRDDDAYADYCEGTTMFGFASKFIGIHYDNSSAFGAILFANSSGSATFTPGEEPFEVKPAEVFELKDPEGNIKYRVSRIVCDTKTLTFTMQKLSSNEDVTVTMGVAPEGFTTNLFEDLLPTLNQTVKEAADPPVSGNPESGEFQQSSGWTCPCGAYNTGNFCTQCGHQRS